MPDRVGEVVPDSGAGKGKGSLALVSESCPGNTEHPSVGRRAECARGCVHIKAVFHSEI